MNFRTDLALERREMIKDGVQGVKVNKHENEECTTTVIYVETDEAAEKLGKAKGKYITIEMNSFSDEAAVTEGRLNAVKESILELLPSCEGTVLVVGVGNAQITSDALGPMTASNIFSTRHISDEMRRRAGLSAELRSVASISTGVLGSTGIESSELIKSVCDSLKPCCVITVDALAAGSVRRLGNTVQLSDTGIAPGSGIGNSRKRIDKDYLGVPVIAIGVPTVVDAVSLSCELSGIAPCDMPAKRLETAQGLIVAPKDIDLMVENASYLLGLSINCALQKNLSAQDLYGLM